MRNLLLLAMGLVMAVPTMAQTGTDVTHFIQNPGFDEDISFTVDAQMAKESVSTASSSASVWYYCADGTIYARNNEGHDSFNGFVTTIKGWTTTFQAGKESATEVTPENCATLKPEWVYFGSVRYDMPAGLFNTGRPSGGVFTTIDPPAKPEGFEGDDNTGVLQLRAGWTNSCSYKQTVNLPAAEYRLEYYVYNSGVATSSALNLCKVTWRDKVVADDTDFGNADGLNQWVKHTIEFKTDAAFTIEFGFQAQNAVSSNQPVIWIDGIKLYKLGDVTEEDILRSDIQERINALMDQKTAAEDAGLDGLCGEIEEYAMELEMTMSGSKEEMEAAKTAADEKIEFFKSVMALVPAIDAVVSKIEAVVNGSQDNAFPGYLVLTASYETFANYKQTYTSEQLLNAQEEAKAILVAYVTSQTDTPADYSLLIDYPWFIDYALQPVDGIYPNESSYTPGSRHDDFKSDGWYKSGEKQDGDQRLNWNQGRSCWNAWATSITTIGVAQDLKGLPNGLYRVSADMMTQPSYVTNQHVFGKSSVGTFESDYLTVGNYIDQATDTEWTTLKAENVVVTDGLLTIGAEGSGMGKTDASGWFLVTNFRLEYLGEANIQNVVEGKANELAELVGDVKFGADKAKLGALADQYQVGGDAEALTVLLAAEKEAKNSIAKYDEIMSEGKTIPTVTASLEEGTYGEGTEIAQFAFNAIMEWIFSEEGTYTAVDSMLNKVKAYVDNYVPVYVEAVAKAASAGETSKNALNGLMAAQKTELMKMLQPVEMVQEFADKLRNVVAAVDMQNMLDANPDMTDFTPFIKNPNAEAQDGWTFNKGNGDGPIKSAGQWIDDSSAPYFDSWNSGGLKGFNYEQLIKGLPNGTYTLAVYARVTTEGAYVFYATGEEKTFVEIPVNYYTDENETQQVASDKYGPIWEEAKAAVDAGTADDLQTAICNANSGQGRGWKKVEMPDIVVDNHQLLIGSAVGSTETLALPKEYGGTWYSTNAWTLIMTEKGNNDGWGGPVADGIETVTASNIALDGVYNLNGVRVNGLQRGLNIIIRNGKAMKVMVK